MNNIQQKSEKEQIIDAIKLCLRHWYYFATSIIICAIFAVIYVKVKTPVMEVFAQVNVRQDDSLKGNVSSGASSLLGVFGMSGNSNLNIEDETLKMSSQGYLKNVIKNLDLNKVYKQSFCLGLVKKNLYDQSPILLTTNSSMGDTISNLVYFSLNVKKEKTTVKIKAGKINLGKYEISSFPATIQTSFGDFTLEKSSYFDQYDKPFKLKILFTNYDYMTQIYKKILSIDFMKKTSLLIDIGMESENVNLAKQIIKEIIKTYNDEWSKDKQYVYDKTFDFISDRINLVMNDLGSIDKKIQEFKEKYNLTDVEADVKYYMTLAGDIQNNLLEAETHLKMVDIIRDFINDEKNKYSLIPFSLTTSDPSIAEVINLYNEQLIKRNEFYRSNQQGAFAQSMDNTIDIQRKNLILSLNNVYKGLQITVQTIKNKEAELNKLMKGVPVIERDFIQLKREQELQQAVYIFLLQKKEETGITSATLVPKLKIINEPYTINKPVAPNKMKVALTALFTGGIIIPLLLIYLDPYLRKKKE